MSRVANTHAEASLAGRSPQRSFLGTLDHQAERRIEEEGAKKRLLDVQDDGPMPPFTVFMKCDRCNEECETIVKRKPGCAALSWFGGLCICGAWWAAWLPFAISDCLDTEHFCPNCEVKLGKHRVWLDQAEATRGFF